MTGCRHTPPLCLSLSQRESWSLEPRIIPAAPGNDNAPDSTDVRLRCRNVSLRLSQSALTTAWLILGGASPECGPEMSYCERRRLAQKLFKCSTLLHGPGKNLLLSLTLSIVSDSAKRHELRALRPGLSLLPIASLA